MLKVNLVSNNRWKNGHQDFRCKKNRNSEEQRNKNKKETVKINLDFTDSDGNIGGF